MLSSRFAGIPISSSTIDGPGVPQLLNRGEQTLRAVTGSGGRLHLGMVAGIKSERRRHQIGIPGRIASEFAEMLSWLRRRRKTAESIDAEADVLIGELSSQAVRLRVNLT